ncbi:MAG: hypothetical protein ABW042_04040 [Phenylobacterium sp.]
MFIAALAALALAGCTPTLGEFRFDSVERVARQDIAADPSFEPKQSDTPWYLRIHFSSKSNLNTLAEDRDDIRARAGACPLSDTPEVGVLGPYAVGQALAVRSRTPGAAAGLARLIERTPDGRYAYTAYVTPSRAGAPPYDLAAEPRDLCLKLEATGGPKGAEASNVFIAPAAAIRAALEAPPASH